MLLDSFWFFLALIMFILLLSEHFTRKNLEKFLDDYQATIARLEEKLKTATAEKERVALRKEPVPTFSDHPACWALVIEDMKDRHEFGMAKYGQPLSPHDGRDSMVDAYQECLDLCVYFRKKIYEVEGK